MVQRQRHFLYWYKMNVLQNCALYKPIYKRYLSPCFFFEEKALEKLPNCC